MRRTMRRSSNCYELLPGLPRKTGATIYVDNIIKLEYRYCELAEMIWLKRQDLLGCRISGGRR